MMGNTKIQLSQEELELMQNAAIILTKNSLLDKVYSGLTHLGRRLEEDVSDRAGTLPVEVLQTSFKVSRGEKYKGLPYIILDYPRVFGKEEVLAIRTMFWWGNYYSSTLHIKGKYTGNVLRNLVNYFKVNQSTGLLLASGEDEWNHDVATGYIPVADFSEQELIKRVTRAPFIKITQKTELAQWGNVEEKLEFYFRQLIELITL